MTLRITDRDGKGVRDVGLANVDSLALLGHVQISTQALQRWPMPTYRWRFFRGPGGWWRWSIRWIR